MKTFNFRVCIVSAALLFFTHASLAQALSAEEKKLYDLVMKYRAEKGLPVIPISKSLTVVAQTHAKDLQDNHPAQGRCNMHSWSSKGRWTPCCYTDDHAKASCMWSKPAELTSYKGNGYEISYMSSDDVTAEGALAGWQKSYGHNQVMINAGIWNSPWKAIGIGVYKNYAVIWFGHEPDSMM
jgi:uncharacterized protein YkwD